MCAGLSSIGWRLWVAWVKWLLLHPYAPGEFLMLLAAALLILSFLGDPRRPACG